MADDWPPGSPGAHEIRAWSLVLRSIPDRSQLRRSPFWRQFGQALSHLLATPHSGDGRPRPSAEQEAVRSMGPWPRRLVHWNILKGISFDGIVAALRDHPQLTGADVILLNEVDVGMARSGNRHVAAELGRRLGMHWVYQPSYLELTKGPGPDALSPGENESGLHGVAVLSRIRPVAWRGIPLPESFDMFAFHEKRLGRRVGLAAALPNGLMVGTAHHEVRGTPLGRAVQVQAFLGGVAAFGRQLRAAGHPGSGILLSGDLNSHTFTRGSMRRTVEAALRLLFTGERRLGRQFDRPWSGGREPLFAVLSEAGYAWEQLNASGPTAHARLPLIEEADRLPPGLRAWLDRWLPFRESGIPLHLDWFYGRDLRDDLTVRAAIVAELGGRGCPSDHAPIVLDLA